MQGRSCPRHGRCLYKCKSEPSSRRATSLPGASTLPATAVPAPTLLRPCPQPDERPVPPVHEQPSDQPVSMRALIVMRVYSLLGLILLAAGILGVWVPVLPTTVFLIGAAACFARSSPRLHAWLIGHPRLGPPLRDWFNEGAISRRGKAAALWGMGIGMAIVTFTVQDLRWVLVAGLVVFASSWYVMARPLPAADQARDRQDAARAKADDDPIIPR